MFKRGSTIRFTLSTILSLALLIVCIVGSARAFSYFFNYTSNIVESDASREKNPNIKEISIEILKGTTVKELADLLYENDFISNPFYFRLESKLSKLDTQLKPGKYSISSNMSNTQILKLLTSDMTVAEETIKFTIPEGYTIIQIADRLENLNIISKESFLDAVNNREYDYAFLRNLPRDTKYALEGYLFPDTYIVRKGATPEEIIIKMLNRFQEIISQYSNYINSSEYSLHEVLAIASIIEQEAKLSEERPIIAGVIYNRLNSDMKLQMCSTVQYVLEKRKAALSYADLEVVSPYNTYTNTGIPIGPICAPGAESISAALMPDTNDYYFFVVKNEAEGSHSFSATASEHERNKTRYKQSVDKNFYE
ncbi:endolytic transglycosylase MltG [Cellulosilyticum sp. I15G10I2]|uniref:endolytic transglycosylase MltG n=1 Tax=Cellulosilyticum sp. I15G10I2 TaxID=1892843 RepID=UPI000941D94A|nr:endolytic transglycosylase MltG [Cellulosilyticum sp. I15G10I2]